jgi:hypothetical protein
MLTPTYNTHTHTHTHTNKTREKPGTSKCRRKDEAGSLKVNGT